MANVRRRTALTEDEAQELSDYVEHLGQEHLGKGGPGPGLRGRPSLTAGRAQHSPSIHVRLPEKLYSSLSRRAGSRGTTVSQVVREILLEHAPR